MSLKSRLKYAIRRPTILGGHRFHPRSPLATKRYESYGNRYLRSRKLSVRLGGSGGTQLCGGGTCLVNTNYGSAGTIKELIYQFAGQDPVSVFTTEDWINFDFSTEVVYGTINGATYRVRITFTHDVIILAAGVCTPSTRISTASYLAYGPATVGDTYYLYDGSPVCGDLVAYGTDFTHNGLRGIAYSCTVTRNLPPATINIAWLINGNAVTVRDQYSQSVEWDRCPTGVTDPDPERVIITVTDPTGVIHTGFGDVGSTAFPSVTIDEGDLADGFVVQSAKYSQVFYTVPIDYSTCNCGDFQQYTPAPNIPIADYRDWRGSGAGPFNPCKHIMAVKRVLGISQNFTDYVSYSNFPYVPELIEQNYQVDSLGRAIKIKPKRFGKLSRIKAFLNAPLFYDAAEEGRRSIKPYYTPRRRSGYHT